MTKGRTQQPRTAAQAASRGIAHRENRENRENRQRSPQSRRDQQSSSPNADRVSAEMNRTIECSVGADQAFTLYIGYLHEHIPKKMIFSVFRKLGVGLLVKGDDAIEMIQRPGRHGKRDHQSAKIHFQHPFLRGQDGKKNADMLNHVATLTDGVTASNKQSFQLEYQGARTNSRTGREEPVRYWEVRYWSDASPTASSRPTVTLVYKATRRPDAPGADGWTTQKKGGRMPPTPKVLASNKAATALGGGFSALAVPKSPPQSPTYTASSPPQAAPQNAVVHDGIEIGEVLAAIDMVHTAGLTEPPVFNADGTFSSANPVDAEMQAAGDLLAAEEQIANEGVGNIPGSTVEFDDFLNVCVGHQYDPDNGTTTDVDPETGEALAIGIN